jgi:hypothetical protein
MDDDEDDDEEDPERLQLPIFSYFALVVGYCAIGSALFNAWEDGAVWSAKYIFSHYSEITLKCPQVFHPWSLLLLQHDHHHWVGQHLRDQQNIFGRGFF